MTMDEEGGHRVSVIPILILIMLVYYGVAPFWLVASIGIWYYSLNYLEEGGHLDSWNFDRVLGIILMARTNRGKSLLEYVSRNRKFWRGFGELSIWVCFLFMAAVVYLISASLVSSLRNPPTDVLPATDVLLIPGVTSFVPFWWPIIALVIALLIHEYSHGIQARAHGMEVRNFGLLLIGPLPVGAFAEPEHLDMSIAPRRERIRLYAAGPSINILATYIVLILLSSTAAGLVAEQSGVHAAAIVEDSAADEAGLLPYETIIYIDGHGIGDRDDFSEVMEQFSAGDTVLLTVLSNPIEGETRESRHLNVTLGDRFEAVSERCEGNASCIEMLDSPSPGDPYLGIYTSDGTSGILRFSYVVDEYGVFSPIFLLSFPMSFDGHVMMPEERAMLGAGDGAIASALGTDGMLMLFDFLFWLMWINFLLGFANLIPIIPFDGGHIVKDTSHSLLSRVLRGENPMKIEMLANKFSYYTTIAVLSIVVIPLIIPLFY